MTRYHYYNFCFATPSAFCSVRIGWTENYVNEDRIKAARAEAAAPPTAALVSVDYLGLMDRETMMKGGEL